jgi:hypothetical protein
LYNMVAVLRFSYGAEVWYSYLHKPVGAGKIKRSVTVTNKLRSIQHKVTKAIMGSLSTTAGNIQDVHTFILPIELLFQKLLYRAALCLCALPTSHPLHPLLLSAAHCKVKWHLSPIHYLLHFVSINLKNVETITPVRRGLGYTPSFKMVIPPSKDNTLLLVTITNEASPVHVYTDGSSFRGNISMATLLYVNECLVKTLRIHLGSSKEHTVYEAEGVGLAMGLHLLNRLSCRLSHTTVLGTDTGGIQYPQWGPCCAIKWHHLYCQ